LKISHPPPEFFAMAEKLTPVPIAIGTGVQTVPAIPDPGPVS